MLRSARTVVIVVGVLLVAAAAGHLIRKQVRVARVRAAQEEFSRAQLAAAKDVPAEVVRSREPLAAELQPVTLSNCQLARMGNRHDGGYLMCANLLAGLQSAYSYGIGGEDSWGCDISRAHRVPVHQYDCFNPTQAQCGGADFRLNVECVGPKQEVIEGRTFDTLANQIARNGDTAKRVVVKMDIEGAEWDTVLAAPDDLLASIDQMPMELHGIDEANVIAGLRKLKQHFYLVSVHFNNIACTPKAAPLPSTAYQVLLVNKRVGIPGPFPPGTPPLESLLLPDSPNSPDCQKFLR
jgi:hypothetical protein